MTKRLDMKGVSKVFKHKRALHPVSLSVGAGECVALCGGNGAGKSTLLDIVAGISVPSEGTVLINQVDIQKNRGGYLSNIGYMPDDFYAQETMTVTEFLSFYGALRKVSRERVQEVIHILGLDAKGQELVKHLSKGMRQRLIFGQAWLANPDVLILDEPTNGLDPYWISVFIDLLKQIKAAGTTIIFSTHMMDVAAEVADLIIFMEDGHIIEAITNDHQAPERFMVDLLTRYRRT